LTPTEWNKCGLYGGEMTRHCTTERSRKNLSCDLLTRKAIVTAMRVEPPIGTPIMGLMLLEETRFDVDKSPEETEKGAVVEVE